MVSEWCYYRNDNHVVAWPHFKPHKFRRIPFVRYVDAYVSVAVSLHALAAYRYLDFRDLLRTALPQPLSL